LIMDKPFDREVQRKRLDEIVKGPSTREIVEFVIFIVGSLGIILSLLWLFRG